MERRNDVFEFEYVTQKNEENTIWCRCLWSQSIGMLR